MPVPNTLIKMINKNAQVESFQISKVQNAISKCIIDVENATSWEAQERAFKYADMVKENAYNNFYNIDFLAEFFTRSDLLIKVNGKFVSVASSLPAGLPLCSCSII